MGLQDYNSVFRCLYFCFNSEINVCACVYTHTQRYKYKHLTYDLVWLYRIDISMHGSQLGCLPRPLLLDAPQLQCQGPQPQRKCCPVSQPLPSAGKLANDLWEKAVMPVCPCPLYFPSVWDHGLKSIVLVILQCLQKWCNLDFG